MRNVEKLRNYYLGHDPQLKETMSDNSLRLCGIPGKFYVLRDELVTELKRLRKELNENELKIIQDQIDAIEGVMVTEQELENILGSYYTKEEIDEIISGIEQTEIKVFDSLDLTDKVSTYLDDYKGKVIFVGEITVYIADPTGDYSYDSYSMPRDNTFYYYDEEADVWRGINQYTKLGNGPTTTELQTWFSLFGWDSSSQNWCGFSNPSAVFSKLNSNRRIDQTDSSDENALVSAKQVKNHVQAKIDDLPEPMVFRGSLGVGGTITALPVDGSATVGDTYKVITDGTYASKTAKVGDTFICKTKTAGSNTWELIPSGDEPSGTVTSIKLEADSPIFIDDSSPITSSGTRTIGHVAATTPGTYKSVTVDVFGHVTSGTNPTTLSGYGITDAEATANKVTSISSSSTDTEYPSAKCVYDICGDVESVLQTLNSGNGV